MNYLDASVRQLQYALSVYRRMEAEGLTPEMKAVGANQHEAVLALADDVLMSFASCAITLNRCCEEMLLPPGFTRKARLGLNSAVRDFACVVYQIRNAVAHDVSEPRWLIEESYRLEYTVGGDAIDLRTRSGTEFEYAHINGIDGFMRLVDFGRNAAWSGKGPLGDRRYVRPV